jgi:hypothetical protein
LTLDARGSRLQTGTVATSFHTAYLLNYRSR